MAKWPKGVFFPFLWWAGWDIFDSTLPLQRRRTGHGLQA